MLERSYGIIVGSSRYSCRRLNPPFFVFKIYSSLELLKFIFGYGILSILFKNEGDKEIGYSTYN
jgi:hypothetical protein